MSARSESFGQSQKLTVVDRFGTWLSERQIARWTAIDGQVIGDFGCGFSARASAGWATRARSLWLVDVSLDPRLSSLPSTHCITGLLPQAMQSVPTGALDVALCLSVLEHLADRDAMLRELHRVTKPGGRVLINVPSWAGKTYLELSAFKLGLSPKAEMDDHKIYYDPRDLWPELVRAGFVPSQIKCFKHKFGLNTFAACTR